jgi:hypothetical protein
MTKLNTFSLVLIISAFLIFLGAYYYHQKTYRHDLSYASLIANVSSTLSPKEKLITPVITSKGYVITEERGLLIAMLSSTLLLTISLGLVLLSKKMHGGNKAHLPLAFTSALIIILIINTTYKIGLFNYA